ncbi:glycosyltransferase [Halioglobus pacificus]|uniref:Glycosyltransferase 2-like domain-containing protein n=1 Tax=Parahalioglobus pacificus TaxID=930806 RepID=A0A918XIA2_9GAMM|nr:glycosyltransferase [Halioglobus pacificus]GHD33734.1 hypothetical protein GCM10007053_18510 [Halioglobus pacificus]
MKPAIVVIAYNRLDAMKRLLHSIRAAELPGDTTLVVSVDYSGDPEVAECAKAFEWQHGEKRVIAHNSNLGLRAHVLSCGDLSRVYGSVILLEDDLYVSPFFYRYACLALDRYCSDDRIAGVSLYTHRWNETACQKFTPLETSESDTFILQLASSWGQCWTKKQWEGFITWYGDNLDWPMKGTEWRGKEMIPGDVARWPDSSWKRYFIRYLIQTDRYFVYPKKSYSTNFSEIGVHHTKKHSVLQAPLEIRHRHLNLLPFDEIFEKYDAFCELCPDSLKRLAPFLDEIDLEIDLYGQKPLSKLSREYLLTIKKSTKPTHSFAMDLKPHELNVIHNLGGDHFHISAKKDCESATKISYIDRARYYFDIHSRYDTELLAETTLRNSQSGKSRITVRFLRRLKRMAEKTLGFF